MGLQSLIANTVNAVTHRRRKLWRGTTLSYLQLRELSGEQQTALQASLDALQVDYPQVQWARVNGPLQVVAVSHQPELASATLEALLDGAERRAAVEQAPLPARVRFPADQDTYFRTLLEMGADLAGLGAGLALRLVPGRRGGLGLDMSALATALENIPALRQPLEANLGPDNTELALTLMANFGEAMMSGWSGSLTDLAHRYHRLLSYRARCQSWAQWEAALCSTPESHGPVHEPAPGRPNALPQGPVEEYSRSASQLALGGFGFGVAATHSFEQAAASVFSGVPKPARLGLDSFVLHTGLTLSREGMLVLNPAALTCLDRVTGVVLDYELVSAEFGMITEVQLLTELDEKTVQRHLDQLFNYRFPERRHRRGEWMLAPLSSAEVNHLTGAGKHPALDEKHFIRHGLWQGDTLVALVYVQRVPDTTAQLVVNRIHQLGLKLYVVDHDENQVAWLHPDALLSREHLSEQLRARQRDDEVLLYISNCGHRALATADLGLALWQAEAPPPWHADLLCQPSLRHAWLLLEAVDSGRRNSRQAVEFSKIEAVAGLVLSLRRLDPVTIRRIKVAANATAFATMVNAVRHVHRLRPCPDAAQTDMTPWHALSVEHVLKQLETVPEGLTDTEANRRLPPVEAHQDSSLVQLARNWSEELFNPLTPMLVAGAALSALTGSVVDAALISGVVVVNGLVGGIQRFQVEAALARLDQQEQNLTRVRRNGQTRSIPEQALARGDVISLKAGELVPADCRIIEAEHLEADESSLTGESLPVKKRAAPTYSPVVAERSSMLYAATTVVQGHCRAVVVATGDATEARRSHALLMEQQNATGVEARLESLTARTLPISALSGALVLAGGLARHQPTDQLISTGVSLAVAAVPEGLPILSTMAQLASAQRLSRQGALVRNPRAIEALGRIDVLCADKTGTLTEGKLTLACVSDGDRETQPGELTAAHQDILLAALRGSPDGFSGKTLPHVTDQALFDGARRCGITEASQVGDWRRVYEKQFKSERGFHAVLGQIGQPTQNLCRKIFIKGAPDKLLALCSQQFPASDGTNPPAPMPLTDPQRQQLEEKARQLADAGLRVLCVAEKTVADDLDRFENGDVTGLCFRGFVALADPIRSTARRSVEALAQAGVEVMMITGDHPATARSIARQLGLRHPDGVITGAQLEQLDGDELTAQLPQTSVFARVTPAQKGRIVQALQQLGHTVAMTGDGANDAAAIRLADVGIALGEKSTPAARAAADLLVASENIDTIVQAVLEGRALWRSVKDAVSLLVGGNLGEIGFTLLGGLLDGRSPLNARQLLLVNMLTDSLPALAVALRRPKHLAPEELLKEGPEQSLGQALTQDIAWRAVATSGAAALAWGMGRLWGSPERASTIALLALVGGQLGQTFAKGTTSRTIVATSLGSVAVLVGVVQTPGLSHFFGCRPLGPIGLSQAALASVISALGSQVLPEVYQVSREWWQDLMAPAAPKGPQVPSVRLSGPFKILRPPRWLLRQTEDVPHGALVWQLPEAPAPCSE
ncbi:MAG: cation-transporting P-type ATPase [Pseudomonadota bacterium]|nr:cation-transporting P-type ATPase [Pseudomonadota bacterium]